MIELTLIPLGFLIATVYSMVGLGGGTIFVPLLLLAFGLPAQQAVGVSLLAIMFMAISSTIAYAIQKKINYKVGLLLDTLDVPGAFIGAYVTTLIVSRWLAGLFGALVLAIAIFMILKRKTKTDSSKAFKLSRRVVAYCMFGSLLSGIVAGLFGIGGGIIDETVMIFMLGMSIHMSAGTAMFGMAITTVAAVIPHWLLGNIMLDYAVPLVIGCVFGAQLGPFLSKRASASTLRKILGVILVLISIRMLLVPFL